MLQLMKAAPQALCTDEADKTFHTADLMVVSPVLRCSSAPPSQTDPIEDRAGT
jgi:hypothetical protein